MKILVAAIVTLSLLGFHSHDARQGEREAREDIAAGRLILRTYGLAGSGAYPNDLYERYGIRVRVVGGCVVDPKLVAKTNAYNAVMKAEIERRFGKGVLDKP